MSPPVERDDDLFWLRDDTRSDPEVLAHLRAENAYAEAHLEHVQPLVEKLYAEIKSSIQESDDDAPFAWGPEHEYFVRTVEGSAYPVVLRRNRARGPSAEPAPEPEVVLDVNEVAKPLKYCSIGAFKPSPCHTLLAYSVDSSGYETYETRFVDLNTNEPLPDVLTNTAGAVSWGGVFKTPREGGGEEKRMTVYYSTQDEAHRCDKVWCHVLGTPQSLDVLVYHETDELFSVGFGRTADGKFVVLESESQETNEVSLIDIDASSVDFGVVAMSDDDDDDAEPEPKAFRSLTHAAPRVMVPRRRGHRYYPEHRRGRWFILSNRDGKINFDLYRTAVSSEDVEGDVDVGEASWEHVPASVMSSATSSVTSSNDGLTPTTPAAGFGWSAGRTLESISAFSDFLLVEGREDGFSQVWVLSLDAAGAIAKTKRTEWPAKNRCVYTATASASLSCVGMNQVFETHEAFLAYSSLNCPRTVYAYDMRDDSKTVVKRTPVLGFDGAKYAAARMEIEVRDGVKVPVSLAWKRRSGTDVDETIAPPRDAPVLLTGYGSYGVSNDPSFARDFVPLMDRGVVVCVAHVRGGGEMGRAWYEVQGKYLRKKNTFRDFVDVASALVANGTTSPEKLAISGRSAGGLLVGASINLAPRLFKCAVAAVPFVDVMVSMCDASIPLTTGEWEEWGNPNEAAYFPYMLSYSPMENVLGSAESPNLARNARGAKIEKTEKTEKTENGSRRPELLVTSGLHDPRVAYWEGAKYAARMREATTPEARVLLKTDLDAGHFSASDRYKYFKEKALEHAFVLDSLGLSGAKPKWQGE